MKKIILLLNLTLFLSCGILKKGGYHNVNNEMLSDTHWMMTDESGVIKTVKNKEAKPLTLYFSSFQNTYKAFLGCNTIQGRINLKKRGEITFLKGRATNMTCMDMSYEKAFIEMIHQVNRYQIDRDILYLYKDKILLMSFKKED